MDADADPRDILIQIPAGAWEALERAETDIALRALALLDRTRVDHSHACLTVGRVLHNVSPTLLPEWTEWASENPQFTAATCAAAWERFPTYPGKPPTLGLLIVFARRDSGDASFAKRGHS